MGLATRSSICHVPLTLDQRIRSLLSCARSSRSTNQLGAFIGYPGCKLSMVAKEVLEGWNGEAKGWTSRNPDLLALWTKEVPSELDRASSDRHGDIDEDIAMSRG